MAARDFCLPDLGEGLTSGEIVAWLVAAGDTITLNQPVAEIETAKAVVEVPSPYAGTVLTLHGAAGDEVAVGAPLISIDTDGDTAGAASAGAAVAGGGAAGAAVDPAPAEGASGNVLVGYGTAGANGRRRRRGGAGAASASASVVAPGAPSPVPPRPPRPLATPPVRKLAKDLGVDLAAITPTGPHGRVSREDIHAHAAAQSPPRPVSTAVGTASASRHGPGEGAGERRVPLRGVRKAIAEKMAVSRREIPDATTWVDADATRLMKLRERLNARQTDTHVSPLAIILRACVAGIGAYPAINARLDVEAGEIVYLDAVHLGVAAATSAGLVVPVISDAQSRTLLELSAELNRLAAAARDRTITPAELTGGTFTVSNYGAFGVDGGSAVIHYPEAAILGVGRIALRPWVHKGRVCVRQVLQLSIAFDHRICDGAEAAGFLRLVADCVEDPGLLLGHC